MPAVPEPGPCCQEPRGTQQDQGQGPGPALTTAPAASDTGLAAAKGPQHVWADPRAKRVLGVAVLPPPSPVPAAERQLGAALHFRIKYNSTEASRL